MSASRLATGCILALTAVAMTIGDVDARPRNKRADQPIASATVEPGTSPEAGPVVSLTKAAEADDLLGANVHAAITDPLAVRVLIVGAAIAPPNGRADNFFVTPEAAIAARAAMPELAARVPATPEPFTTAAASSLDSASADRAQKPPEPANKQLAANINPAAAVGLQHVRTPLPPVRPAPRYPHRLQARASFDPFGLFR
jgi:hypothetical protein